MKKITKQPTLIKTTFLLFFIIGINAFAQTKTSKEIENVKETVEEAGKLFKSVFGKKNTDQQKENTEGNAPNSNKETLPKERQLKAGSIHPDAVVLDVDKLYPFYKGAAIVQKGKSTALINAKGELIVPFNKYDIDIRKSKNGFFILREMEPSRGKVGFLNSSGKFIDLKEFYGGNYRNYHPAFHNNFNYLRTYDKTNKITCFIDSEGNVFKLQNSGIVEAPCDGMIIFNIGMKKGYKNLKDQIVIKPIYDYAGDFSNSAAVVGKKDEFGEIKYGYIDTKGNAITPLQFSKKPEPFSSDRAKVYYREINKYSFIDKKGQVLFTESSSYGGYGPFIYNYSKTRARGGSVIMDVEGNTYSEKEFLKLLGINDDITSSQIEFPNYTTAGFDDKHVINFWFDSPKTGRNNGLLFLNEKKAFNGAFRLFYDQTQIGVGTHIYDPISKLTIAIFNNSNNYGDTTEGYVNEEGVFMIVKGKKSKW